MTSWLIMVVDNTRKKQTVQVRRLINPLIDSRACRPVAWRVCRGWTGLQGRPTCGHIDKERAHEQFPVWDESDQHTQMIILSNI